ncbi:hypothetical protein NKR19_g3438 [Coniochaeta hoffmannii]|uniref:Uncharacterized protein n=1 Tax=Coniochaeta hoffmannii TaxID=91930 RepID=A0AA38S8R8_9PEZI|nr:hypothetical protein NKR19_g3438 [Coniochaeta hoffmannii]
MPLKPTPEEVANYYLGLPSRPCLVARADYLDNPWEMQREDEHDVLKHIYPVARHPILSKLEEDVWVLELTAVLHPLHWNSLDLVRIGDGEKPSDNPVVIWLAVAPGTATFEEGWQAVSRVRKFLVQQRGGLEDVEVEIREAFVEDAATPVKSITSNFANQYPTLTSTLGQSVASSTTPKREGSLTCFVNLIKKKGNPPIKAALMSRHVVFKNDEPDYNYKTGMGTPKVDILMPGQRTLDMIVGESDAQAKFWKNWHGKDAVEEVLAEKFAADVHGLELPSARRLGHVLFAKSRRKESINHTGVFDHLPDVAVVELEPTRLGNEYHSLANTVYVSVTDLTEINRGLYNPQDMFHMPNDNLLHLRGIVPIEEICSPKAYEHNTKEHVLRVGKRGIGTGLT